MTQGKRAVGVLVTCVLYGCGSSEGESAPPDGATGGAATDAGSNAASSIPAPEPDECITDVAPGLHEFTCGADWPKYAVNVPEMFGDRPVMVIVGVANAADQRAYRPAVALKAVTRPAPSSARVALASVVNVAVTPFSVMV